MDGWLFDISLQYHDIIQSIQPIKSSFAAAEYATDPICNCVPGSMTACDILILCYPTHGMHAIMLLNPKTLEV